MTFFAPLVGSQPSTLILGSMPSRKSLSAHQYYANPQNAFWWIVSRIYGFDDCASYRQRVTGLTGAGIAVWDVLADAQRPGSLDSRIIRASEKANNFGDFFEQQPTTKLIGFNGTAAKQIFMRHCANVLQIHPHLRWIQLPSTSPAHAAVSKAQKLMIWRKALSDPKHGKSNV